MPIYDVTDENTGVSISLEGDSPPTESELQSIFKNEIQRQRDQLVGRQQREVKESQRLTEELAPGQTEAALRGGMQGLTLGFGEEMSSALGAVPSAFTGTETYGERYKKLRDEMRAGNRLAQQAYPKTYLGGELAGGMATGVAGMGRNIATQTLKQALPRLATVGAVEGGIGGAGFSEAETAGGLARDVAVGAGAGAVLGAGLPVAGRAIGSFTKGAASKLSREARAARTVQNDMAADNLTMAQAETRLAENPSLVLADLGENLQQRIGAMANRPGSTAQRARDFFEGRNIEQLDRLTPKFEQALGGKGTLDAMKESVQRTREAAAPLYDIAYETPIRATAPLQELMQRPTAKAALTKAKRLAADEGVEIQTGEANVLLIDYVQRSLRDMEQSVKFKAPNKARIMGNLRKDILTEVDNQVPEFLQARRIAADEFANRDALDLGSKLFREKTPNLREAYAGMAQSEKDHFRIGVFDAVIDRLGTKVETANLIQDFRKPKFRQAMQIAFDDPALFRQFEQTIGDERAMFETMRKALQGSPTASRLNFQQGEDVAQLAATGLQGGMANMAAAAGRQMMPAGVERALAAGRERQAGAIGDVLLSATPQQQLQRLVQPPRQTPQAGTLLPAASLPATEQLLQSMGVGPQ